MQVLKRIVHLNAWPPHNELHEQSFALMQCIKDVPHSVCPKCVIINTYRTFHADSMHYYGQLAYQFIFEFFSGGAYLRQLSSKNMCMIDVWSRGIDS